MQENIAQIRVHKRRPIIETLILTRLQRELAVATPNQVKRYLNKKKHAN